jgi:putative SOS response-associated peptidase YedK
MTGRFVLAVLRSLHVRKIHYKEQAAVERKFSIVKPWWSYSSTLDATVQVVRTIDGERTCMMMRWPLIHTWAAGGPVKFATHNAKEEMIETKTWLPVWTKGKRCIVTTGGICPKSRDVHYDEVRPLGTSAQIIQCDGIDAI